MQQEFRIGRGTSSNAYIIASGSSLQSPNKPFYTYAEEVAIERLTKVPVQPEINAKSLAWGSLMECVVYDQAIPDTDMYFLVHKKTILHPKMGNIWSGTPDLISPKKTGEIKCHFRKNYVLFYAALKSRNIEFIKRQFPQAYWQLVSNCILTKKKVGELVGFIPKKSELLKIFEAIQDTDFLKKANLEEHNYFYYQPEYIESHPYLADDAEIDNFVTFEFEIPQDDKIFLTQRFKMFEKEVEEKYKFLTGA